MSRRAVIIGAGPAGLTAAYELLHRTDVIPVVLEATGEIGGLSKTVEYKGNRIDIGGHRFFSKSDAVTEWWEKILPLQGKPSRDDLLLGRTPSLSAAPGAPDPETTEKVMLLRERLSRIFFLRKLFSYPITLSAGTLRALGAARILRIGFSYLAARLNPIRRESSLEDFFVNRFGRVLYETFFRDYTEKVWGIPCRALEPEWGAQRVKGVSVTEAILHALSRLLGSERNVETSLIEQFRYPRNGPGQMWEEVARIVAEKGGSVLTGHRLEGVRIESGRVVELSARNAATGERVVLPCDFAFSSAPVKDLIEAMSEEAVPPDVFEVAKALRYRDFMTAGLLVRKLKIRNETGRKTLDDIVPDNWIYIQEKDVKLGRLQIFNNWSPYMVRDPATVWLGLEYFCDEGDALWRTADADFRDFAADELAKLGIIEREDVLDGTVIRMAKAYPAYYGAYERFGAVRAFTDRIENLFLIGRNGMHRYNNADHSMLSAIAAVDNIVAGVASKENIWEVNTEEEYHEAKEG